MRTGVTANNSFASGRRPAPQYMRLEIKGWISDWIRKAAQGLEAEEGKDWLDVLKGLLETPQDGTVYSDLIDWQKSKDKLTRVYHTKIL